jgi:nitroimidazol reductase NimA-like FMN-containing flavoprotein (pyridoxamine 5'-phosphate oxidase superfamily)
MLGILNQDQINNVLSSQVMGRLSCTDGKTPYIVPVTYIFDGEYLYSQSNEGTKLEIMRKNPQICFEVDIMSNMQNWQCVLVFGTFEELNAEQSEKARELLYSRIFTLMTSSTVHKFGHSDEALVDIDEKDKVKQIMYRIKIDKVTGRFETQ